jgi:MFS transporter, SP family, arabinose:H+ symporter
MISGIDKSYPVNGDKYFLALVCFVASLGGVLFGFDTAVISGTFSMVRQYFDLGDIEVGWFASSALVGAIAGALVSGMLSDKYGRKPTLILSAVLFFISAFASAVPNSFSMLISARLLGGIGVGMASVLAPMYISEFSPPNLRGRLVALYQFSIVTGILLAYFSNWLLLEFSAGSGNEFSGSGIMGKILVTEVWRGMFGAEMIPSGLFILSLFFIPESPRWLIKNHHSAKGFHILATVSGEHIARKELAEIKATVNHIKGKITDLIKPGLRLALMVGVGLSVFGQFTGVNIIVYYGPTILEGAGFKLDSAIQYQVAIGVINLVFTSLALWKIDRWGRRPLLIGGMSAVCLSLFILALLFALGEGQSWLILIIVCVYMASLALSINAVIWVLIGEIYPTRIRGRGMSIATFANWTTNFFTAFLFPWYVGVVGMHIGFLTFAVICLFATFFFYKMVPETKGKSLEEIEQIFSAAPVNKESV